MGLFGWLILAHLLYDFHWQGTYIAENKSKNNFILAVHALTWALLLSGVLSIMGLYASWQPIILFLTHFFTDKWKCRYSPSWGLLYIDQILHLIVICLVVIITCWSK